MKKLSFSELTLEFPSIDSLQLNSIKGGDGYDPFGSSGGQWGTGGNSFFPNADAPNWSLGFGDNQVGYSPSRDQWGYWTSTGSSTGVTSTWHSISEPFPGYFNSIFGNSGTSGSGGGSGSTGGGYGGDAFQNYHFTSDTFAAAFTAAGIIETAETAALAVAFSEVIIPAALCAIIIGVVVYNDSSHYDPYDPSKWNTTTGEPWIPGNDQYTQPDPNLNPFPSPNDNLPTWVKAVVGAVGFLAAYDAIADKMGWPRLDPWDNNPPATPPATPPSSGPVIYPWQSPGGTGEPGNGYR